MRLKGGEVRRSNKKKTASLAEKLAKASVESFSLSGIILYIIFHHVLNFYSGRQ